MRKLFLSVLLVVVVQLANAQTNSIKLPKLDESVLDMVYYPLNAAKSKGATQPRMRVLYSRPQKKGREIFGVLEQYDKVWRLGANESTEIQFFTDVIVGKKKIKAGRYSLFAIPGKEQWVLIINKITDRWGAFSYDSAKDVARVQVPVIKLDKPVEALSITFDDSSNGANLVIAWDFIQVQLPILLKK